jgi:hypothetical protein
MAKSREEVLADLRSVFGKAESGVATKSPPAAAPSPKAPAKAGSIFAKFKKIEDEAADQDETEEEVEEVEEESEESEEVAASVEPDARPLDELLDRIENLINYISANDEAIKSWLNACR